MKIDVEIGLLVILVIFLNGLFGFDGVYSTFVLTIETIAPPKAELISV